MPPHNPYNTRAEFIDRFADGRSFIQKPYHPLFFNYAQPALDELRRQYDEFIPYVDAEFARLYARLEADGLLQNTILVLTSDHGEMFERGIWGHSHPTLHEPVIHIPLLIFHPQISQRIDIHTPTSAVDLLPTLARLAGQPAPAWAEGHVLPPFAPAADRPIFAVEAKDNPAHLPLQTASFAIIRWPHKLTLYRGYAQLAAQGGELVELYDIQNDPEELHDLSAAQPQLTAQLRAELEAQVNAADAPYRRQGR